jgi:hypothetical protein
MYKPKKGYPVKFYLTTIAHSIIKPVKLLHYTGISSDGEYE